MYNLMAEQIRELIKTDNYYLPVLANTSALLWDTLPQINWAGFYKKYCILRRRPAYIIIHLYPGKLKTSA